MRAAVSHKLTGLYDNNPFIPGQTLRRFNQTPGNPTNAFSYLDTFANVGNANYIHSSLASVDGPQGVRHVGNLSYQFSYTYGKSEDTTSGFRARNKPRTIFRSKNISRPFPITT